MTNTFDQEVLLLTNTSLQTTPDHSTGSTLTRAPKYFSSEASHTLSHSDTQITDIFAHTSRMHPSAKQQSVIVSSSVSVCVCVCVCVFGVCLECVCVCVCVF